MNPASGAQAARHRNDPDTVRRLLATPGRWAVVGLSQNRARVAYRIAAYLQELGMEIVPVHPRAEPVFDRQAYASLAEVPGPIDVVDMFRRSNVVGAHVDEAIEVGAKAVWLQVGVIDVAAAERARQAGLLVVMDRCPKVELPALRRRGASVGRWS